MKRLLCKLLGHDVQTVYGLAWCRRCATTWKPL